MDSRKKAEFDRLEEEISAIKAEVLVKLTQIFQGNEINQESAYALKRELHDLEMRLLATSQKLQRMKELP